MVGLEIKCSKNRPKGLIGSIAESEVAKAHQTLNDMLKY
jgi:hypothetical protein